MSRKKEKDQKPSTSRRDFIRTSSALVAGVGAASGLSVARGANAYGSDTIKIGLIGCGGRGTGAAIQAMNTTGGGVNLMTMADAFGDPRWRAFIREKAAEYGDA